MRDGNEKNLEVQAGYFEREGTRSSWLKVTFIFYFTLIPQHYNLTLFISS